MKWIFMVINLQIIHAFNFDLDLDLLHFIFVHGSTPTKNTYYSVSNVTDILSHPKFNFDKTTALFIHGWFDSFDSIGTQAITSAYIQRGDHNFIIFDWGNYDVTLLPIAVSRSHLIAPHVGSALLKLFESGLSSQKFHCVGHSIGAHMCGTAGQKVIHHSSGRFKFQRITALDPARQYFHTQPTLANALTCNDANFVDAIHTDASNRGTFQRVGHADFYPDGGMFQSSCPPVHLNYITAFCSHWKSWLYYANSLKNEKLYPSKSCNSFSEFKKGFCDNAENFMGYAADPQTQGVFYLKISKNDTLTIDHYLQAFSVITKSIFTKSDLKLFIKKFFKIKF